MKLRLVAACLLACTIQAFGQNQSSALVQLGVKGVVTSGGSTNQGSCLIKTKANGKLDSSFIPAFTVSVTPLNQVIYIDSVNGSATNNGCMTAPYESLTTALAATTGAVTYILSPGVYSMAGSITANTHSDITLVGFNAATTRISGLTYNIAGEPITLRLYNIQLDYLEQDAGQRASLYLYDHSSVSTVSSVSVYADPTISIAPGGLTVSNLCTVYNVAYVPSTTVSGLWTNNTYITAQQALTTLPSWLTNWVLAEAYAKASTIAGLASTAWVSNFVYSQGYTTTNWVTNYIASQGFATTNWTTNYIAAQGFATTNWVTNYVALQGFATTNWVTNYVALQGFATTNWTTNYIALQGFATTNWVTNYVALQRLDTTNWVVSQHFVTFGTDLTLNTDNHDAIMGLGLEHSGWEGDVYAKTTNRVILCPNTTNTQSGATTGILSVVEEWIDGSQYKYAATGNVFYTHSGGWNLVNDSPDATASAPLSLNGIPVASPDVGLNELLVIDYRNAAGDGQNRLSLVFKYGRVIAYTNDVPYTP